MTEMEPSRLHVDIFVPWESADSVCVCPAGRKQAAETQSSTNQRRKRRRRKARQDEEGGGGRGDFGGNQLSSTVRTEREINCKNHRNDDNDGWWWGWRTEGLMIKEVAGEQRKRRKRRRTAERISMRGVGWLGSCMLVWGDGTIRMIKSNNNNSKWLVKWSEDPYCAVNQTHVCPSITVLPSRSHDGGRAGCTTDGTTAVTWRRHQLNQVTTLGNGNRSRCEHNGS